MASPERLSLAEHPELAPTNLLRGIAFLPPFPLTGHGYGELVDAIARHVRRHDDRHRPG